MKKNFLQESKLCMTEFEQVNADFLSIGEKLLAVLKIDKSYTHMPDKIAFLQKLSSLVKEKKEKILFVPKHYNELHVLQTQVIERILKAFSSIKNTEKDTSLLIRRKIADVLCCLTKSKNCLNQQYTGELPGSYTMSKNNVPIKKEPEASVITELLHYIADGKISTQTTGNRFYYQQMGSSPNQRNRSQHIMKIFHDEKRVWFYAGYLKYAGIDIPVKGRHKPLIDIVTLEKIIQNIFPEGLKIKNLAYIQQIKKQIGEQEKRGQQEAKQEDNATQHHNTIDLKPSVCQADFIGHTDHPAKFGKNTIRKEPKKDLHKQKKIPEDVIVRKEEDSINDNSSKIDYNQEMVKLKKYFQKPTKKPQPEKINFFLNYCEDMINHMANKRMVLIYDEVKRLLLKLDPDHKNNNDIYIIFLHKLEYLCGKKMGKKEASPATISPYQEILRIEEKILQGMKTLENFVKLDRRDEGQKLINLGPQLLKNTMGKYNEILNLLTDLCVDIHKKEKIFLDFKDDGGFIKKNYRLKDSLMQQEEFVDAQKQIYETRAKEMKKTYDYMVSLVNTPLPTK